MVDLSVLTPDLTPEDMPGMLSQVADRCGVPDAMALLLKVPGSEIYVPVSGAKILKHLYIKENFNGSNLLSISGKLGMPIKDVQAIADSDEDVSIEAALRSVYMKIVSEICGVEVAKRLLIHFSGIVVKVPVDVTFLKRKYVERFHDGRNTVELAIRLRVTEGWVRKVIAEHYRQRRPVQIDLFSNPSASLHTTKKIA